MSLEAPGEYRGVAVAGPIRAEIGPGPGIVCVQCVCMFGNILQIGVQLISEISL